MLIVRGHLNLPVSIKLNEVILFKCRLIIQLPIMTFQRRFEAVKQVVEIVLSDLSKLACIKSVQEHVLSILVQIDNDIGTGDRNMDPLFDRHILDTKSEQELDNVYTIVTSDEFYQDVTEGCKNLCMNNLKHPIFENQDAYIN
jgi:hypothetical protein